MNMATNQMLYISSLLATTLPSFHKDFTAILKQENIAFSELENTNDIWVKDFMPIQINENEFVQFVYNPDYLKKEPNLKTNPKPITSKLGINCFDSEIVIDGGNVIRNKDFAFVTDKIFKENPSYKKEELIEKLTKQLKVKKLIVVPKQPYDTIGHTDGMVRFINDSTIVINDYSDYESKTFVSKFEKSFRNLGLTIHKAPYYHTNEKVDGIYTAEGCYINFIELNNHIFLPQFGNKKFDKQALDFYISIFPNKKVIPANCKELSKKGGVLNCISWIKN